MHSLLRGVRGGSLWVTGGESLTPNYSLKTCVYAVAAYKRGLGLGIRFFVLYFTQMKIANKSFQMSRERRKRLKALFDIGILFHLK